MTRFRLLQWAWDLRSSMLVIPLLEMVAIGAVAVLLASAERAVGLPAPWLAVEPGTAQVVLATLAGAMMTVISVVYSILLVALSLASVQFSTRILAGMVRDPVSQGVLGLFLGTFVWQLVALRAIHLDPPWVPPFTTSFALGLAVLSLLALVVFIDRIIVGVQANTLVDRIATEAEAVIDEVFPLDGPAEDARWAPAPEGAARVVATRSGYVQLVSAEDAARVGVDAWLLRPMGAFVPEGAALWAVHPPEALTPAVAEALRAAVDLGPIRTMQQDVEWGVRQIVDIGLKAISPAVNDPSTGATCLDHLSRLLIRAGNRGAPRATFPAAGGRAVVIPAAVYTDLVDLAFEQIRQYGRGDLAIAHRLLRAMADVVEGIRHADGRAHLGRHAEQVARVALAQFPDDDHAELDRRLARVRRAVARG